jgi:hypothetical protein
MRTRSGASRRGFLTVDSTREIQKGRTYEDHTGKTTGRQGRTRYGGSRGIGAAIAKRLAGDVASVAGPESSYVTGANLTVDGGMNA